MKTIGIVGGMSWESTTLYYQLINREVRRRCGALHSAPLLLHSLDFEPIVAAQRAGAWDTLAQTLVHSARLLEAAGAELLVIATNTMHRVADEVQSAVAIPLLHIVDTTAAALRAQGCRRLALLGTRYTMEQPFWAARLAHAGVHCLVPDEADRALVHRVSSTSCAAARCTPHRAGTCSASSARSRRAAPPASRSAAPSCR